MKSFELHSLYWPNVSQELVGAHRRAFNHIGVPVTYTTERVRHSTWLDRILEERLRDVDVVGFVDIDCLAYSNGAVTAAVEYVQQSESFLGLAQSANHLRHPMHIYAAPAFLLVSRQAFERLKRPSLRDGPDWDVGQNLSAVADSVGFSYRVLYPIGFYRGEKTWRLGNFGHYGQGTEYEGGFFHNFNSRTNEAIDLFRQRADAIVADEPQPATLPQMSRSLSVAGVDPSLPRSDTVASMIELGFKRIRHKVAPFVPNWVRSFRDGALRTETEDAEPRKSG